MGTPVKELQFSFYGLLYRKAIFSVLDSSSGSFNLYTCFPKALFSYSIFQQLLVCQKLTRSSSFN
jgi:hypothetical protein